MPYLAKMPIEGSNLGGAGDIAQRRSTPRARNKTVFQLKITHISQCKNHETRSCHTSSHKLLTEAAAAVGLSKKKKLARAAKSHLPDSRTQRRTEL